MYGRAEQVIGEIATKLHLHESLFLATKVWTSGKQQGIDSMEKSLAKLQVKSIDSDEGGSLVDVQIFIRHSLRNWKQQGRKKYVTSASPTMPRVHTVKSRS